ncbi:MAG: hypothetical protein JRH11_25255, partial [Deltaproteobacteria bacterium]|nr:hypothetical protein [Deltaproteobacteria bacterium]
ADGTVDLSAFPNTRPSGFITRLLAVADETPAFGLTSTIFFKATAALDASSVEVGYAASLEDDAPVFLVRVPSSPDEAPSRHPVEVQFREDGGPWGAENLISLLPLQGRPLEPGLYAAVVTDRVRTAAGEPLTAPAALDSLRMGEQPPGLGAAAFAAHQQALAVLAAPAAPPVPGAGAVDLDAVVGLAVFEAVAPTGGIEEARRLALDLPLPAVTGLALDEVFDGYCVYAGMTLMPDYQRGELPYDDGGAWDLTMPPNQASARVVISVPRAAVTAPVPVVVMSRTGGGVERPLIDRGFRPVSGGPPAEAGSGPARDFATVGWAGVSIDGPHGGPRNPDHMDEQFLVFNVNNPIAMRDNVRQSALELVVAAHMMNGLTVDASDCPGVDGAVTFQARALMGHSMGATIAPLAFDIEPLFEGLILNGAGGSWIMNVVHKQSPVPVRPFAELLLGIGTGWMLHEHDPSLMLLQWAGESADPPVYAARLGADSGRHVLMFQGITDTYILPPMANATSLSYGLDLGGPALDSSTPDLASFASLEERLPMSSGEAIALPAQGNQGGATRVVVQHAEDGIEDGHEVVFQSDAAKAQYRCFLETLGRGEVPTVPATDGACP